jgi:hypothetical protein
MTHLRQRSWTGILSPGSVLALNLFRTAAALPRAVIRPYLKTARSTVTAAEASRCI